MSKSKETVSEEKFKSKIGGQAVIEGVMMRGIDKAAMACRLPSGEIDLEEFIEVVFGEEAVGNLRLVADDAGNFPALAALFHCANIVVQEGFESFAAPYFLFKDGGEFQGV